MGISAYVASSLSLFKLFFSVTVDIQYYFLSQGGFFIALVIKPVQLDLRWFSRLLVL